MTLLWSPPVLLSADEQWLISKCKKARLFVFLREHRHELFDDAFQRELIAMYPQRTSGREPVPPALLAMVTLLQAAFGISDEDAVELAVVERRWQMLLGCLDERDAPFSQGVLFTFRQRLMAANLDRRLLERTVELALHTRGFSDKALRAAFDASPLFGAGRVEDTFNLIGHAAREVLRVVATRLHIDIAEAATRAGIPLLTGSSLKAALDVDWDDPNQKQVALTRLLDQVQALHGFLERELKEALAVPPLSTAWAAVEQIIAQDLEPDPNGSGLRIKHGVAKERRISIRDSDMRHGRKSKTSRVDGFKRHLALDVASRLILATAVTPANRPEGEASDDLLSDVARHKRDLTDLHIDRGYLAAPAVHTARAAGVTIHCKPFPLRNHGRYTKADFTIDLAAQRLTCPAGNQAPFALGGTAHFEAANCSSCPQRGKCTSATNGRSVAIHAHEPFLIELRATQKTPDGRHNLRKRTAVEHSLAAIGRTQTKKARYIGLRKNLFDLRRHAAVANLHVAAAA